MRFFIGLVLALALGVVGCGGGDGLADDGVCESFCAKEAECYPEQAQNRICADWCPEAVRFSSDFGAQCFDATVDELSCAANLSCEQLDAYFSKTPFDNYPCQDAAESVRAACTLEDDSCDSFCATQVECNPAEDRSACEAWCGSTLYFSAAFSDECLDVTVDTLTCVASLSSCEQVEAYNSSTPPDSYPCKAGDDEIRSACY